MQPFRFEPTATQLDRAVTRPRLTTLLAARFQHRLTTVTGAAGYGKTTALALAIDNNRLDPLGLDVFVGATESDADPDHLLAGLARALGVEPGEHEATIRHLIDAVWTSAPTEVVVMIDDAHHIDSPASLALITRLLRELPSNGHLLLASRRPLDIPTARLRAHGELLDITESDLQFDDAELDELRSRRHAVGTRAVELPRHAASADLCIAAGPAAGSDFLWEEILSAIDDDRLVALKCCAVLSELDDGTVVPLTDGRFTTDALVAGLPLVDGEPGGTRRMHALLRDALLARLAPGERRKACSIAADIERDRERFPVAIGLYREAGDQMAAHQTGREFILLPILRHSIESVAIVRRHMREIEPDGAVSAALDATSNFGGNEEQMLPNYLRSADLARRDGDDVVEALALYRVMQYTLSEYALPTQDRLQRLEELAVTNTFAAGAVAVTRSQRAQFDGDVAGALAELDALELLGPINAATVRAERLCDLARPELVGVGTTPGDLVEMPPGSEVFVAYAMWLRADAPPELANEFVRSMAAAVLRRGYAYTSISTLGVATVIALTAGDVAAARRYAEHVQELGQIRLARTFALYVHVTGAALASCTGHDDDAARMLDPAVTGVPVDRWPARPHLLILPLLYLVRPEVRPVLDRCDFGTVITVAVRAGQALAGVREADPADADAVARAQRAAAALPWNTVDLLRVHVLPHHLAELAIAAIAGGSAAAEAALDAIPSLTVQLRRVARDAIAPIAARAVELLDGAADEPPFALSVRVLGQVELRRGGEVVLDDDWQRRQMVRSLLALMLDRRRLHRLDVIELLWPGHTDEAKAVGNLRTTLSMLQRVLEPDRDRDAPPFFLRSDQDHLTLHASVTSDAAEFDALVAAAQADDQAGLPSRALHGYQRALEVYRGDYLADVDAAWAVFTRLRLRSLALNAACRVAELLAARGEPEESARLAQRALRIDPHSERAGRLLVAAIDATGDLSAAREAGSALLAMLDRIDATPAPETVRVLFRIGIPAGS